jgi:transcriptional regulator with XRE-family HTH domain
MERDGLTSSRFADKIGVQRPALSHVLNGRNKVSLEMVTKILKAYPEVSPDWLIQGEGEMLKEHALITSEEGESRNEDIAIAAQSASVPSLFDGQTPNTESHTVSSDNPEQKVIYMDRPAKSITKIMIFFSDDTFETFTSEKNRNE